MSVEAGVLERALALSFVEMGAGDLGQRVAIFFEQRVLQGSRVDHAARRDDQITVFSTDWACPVVRLFDFLIVSCSPVTYAI